MRATSDAFCSLSVQPSRILTLTGTGIPFTISATSLPRCAGRCSNVAPMPRRTMSWIGQPQFRSTQLAPRSAAALPAAIASLAFDAATCAPKQVSSACLRSSASSLLLRLHHLIAVGHLAHRHGAAVREAQAAEGEVAALGQGGEEDAATEVHPCHPGAPSGPFHELIQPVLVLPGVSLSNNIGWINSGGVAVRRK
jgi:hypothetical protein